MKRVLLGVAVLVAGVTIALDPAGASSSTSADAACVSNGGRYHLEVRGPEGGFVTGKSLAFEVRVARASDPEASLETIALVVDADMPEHLHGVNRVPRVERRPDGSFRVENLWLHMPGWWEVYLDVVEGPWTERAQLRVEVD